MYNRLQFNVTSAEDSIQVILKNEITPMLSNRESELIIFGAITVPGIMLFDSNLPIFYFYNLENCINDSDRFTHFCKHLKVRYSKIPNIQDKSLNKFGLITEGYIVSFDYIAINKSCFDEYLIGRNKELNLEEGYRDIFLNAYAEFMINSNVVRLFRENPRFKLESLINFKENSKTKLELLEVYIQEYGFSRYMEYIIEGTWEGVQFLKIYL